MCCFSFLLAVYFSVCSRSVPGFFLIVVFFFCSLFSAFFFFFILLCAVFLLSLFSFFRLLFFLFFLSLFFPSFFSFSFFFSFSDVVGWLTRSGGVRCPQLLAIPAGSLVGDSRPERDQARGHCLSLSVAGRGSFRPAGAGPALTRSFPPGARLLTDHASVASRAPGWFPVLFRKHLAGKGLGGTPKSGGRLFADPLRCDRSMAGF